jgi:hypothetical protein
MSRPEGRYRRDERMNEPTKKTVSTESVAFRWRFIALPMAILLLSIILTAYFYRLLPVEAAYHFESGLPDRWMSRIALVAWLVIPQFFFALLAWITTRGAAYISNRFQTTDSAWMERIILIMGNMIALPQIMLGFAMLDIFSYNAYQIHLIPLWVFAVIVMGAGGIVLGAFFFSAIRQVWGKSSPR